MRFQTWQALRDWSVSGCGKSLAEREEPESAPSASKRAVRHALFDHASLGGRATAVEQLLQNVAAERVEAEGEEVAGERVLVRLRELLVAVLEAARDEEVACRQRGSVTCLKRRRRSGGDAPNLLNPSSRTCLPTASKISCLLSGVVDLTFCCRKSEHCWSLCLRMRRMKACEGEQKRQH